MLQANGRSIPENDIWIAAVAQQHRLTLVTRNAHFDLIDGLNIETW
jgi:tRNA(fMet)-specific endonuclease VapC